MGNRVFNLMGLSRFKSEIWGKLLEISKNRDIQMFIQLFQVEFQTVFEGWREGLWVIWYVIGC